MQAHRPTVMGTRHMAAACHYLAAEAAYKILEASGNAIDAGVAGGIALGVVQPEYVNVAGVAPIILYSAAQNRVVTISGLGIWPRALDRDLFKKHHGGKIPSGVLRTVVPAAPDAWITALEQFGTMRFGEVAAAAIRFARDGFPVYPLMAEVIAEQEQNYRRFPSNAALYLPQNRPPRPGEIFVQADLARTLQYMVDEERAHQGGGREAGLKAARDAFYRGDIAAAIVRFQEENGGLLSAEDLAEYRSEIEAPVHTRFGDIDVYGCGPWCQGPSLLQALNLVDAAELQRLGHNSPAYLHRLAEAVKLAFADREAYFGDPRFVDVPMAALLSPEYAALRRKMIRSDTAWPEMPPAGTAEELAVARAPRPAPAAPSWQAPEPDTSYVCVVDRHGNLFSATPSDGSYNAPVIPGLGICPSPRGSQSWGDPDHPSGVAPGKRPRLTPNPALAMRPGDMVMPFGTPGGDVQTQAMLQVFLNINLFGMEVQSAIEAPRFASYSFPSSFEPHAYHPGRLNLEGRLARDTGSALRDLGHKVEWWPDWTWLAGSVCTIRADRRSGVLHGGADPRRRPTLSAGDRRETGEAARCVTAVCIVVGCAGGDPGSHRRSAFGVLHRSALPLPRPEHGGRAPSLRGARRPRRRCAPAARPRRILAHGLLVDRALDGQAVPMGQIVPEEFGPPGTALAAEKPDTTAAQRLLTDAGLPKGFGLTLACTNDRYVNDAQVCQGLGQMLSRAGIKTKVEALPGSVFFPKIRVPKSEVPLILYGTSSSSTRDATHALSLVLHSYDPEQDFGQSNRGNFRDGGLDRLIEAAVFTLGERRETALRAAMAEGMRLLSAIPLYDQMTIAAARKGIIYTPRMDEQLVVTGARPQ